MTRKRAKKPVLWVVEWKMAPHGWQPTRDTSHVKSAALRLLSFDQAEAPFNGFRVRAYVRRGSR